MDIVAKLRRESFKGFARESREKGNSEEDIAKELKELEPSFKAMTDTELKAFVQDAIKGVVPKPQSSSTSSVAPVVPISDNNNDSPSSTSIAPVVTTQVSGPSFVPLSSLFPSRKSTLNNNTSSDASNSTNVSLPKLKTIQQPPEKPAPVGTLQHVDPGDIRIIRVTMKVMNKQSLLMLEAFHKELTRIVDRTPALAKEIYSRDQTPLDFIMEAAMINQIRRVMNDSNVQYPFQDIKFTEPLQKDQRKLFYKEFVYQILPDEVQLVYAAINVDENFRIESIRVKIQNIEDCTSKGYPHDPKQMRRFFSFLCYQPYAEALRVRDNDRAKLLKVLLRPDIDPTVLEAAVRKISDPNGNFVGGDSIANAMYPDLKRFTDPSVQRPRGILFWGPPGTGKTYGVCACINELEVQMVTDGILAPGDFNQNIVGDTERMINHIADRARQVPWQLCAIVVDEIETLVLSRTGSNKSGGDKLAMILAIITGGKDVPNLIMFGCTNVKEVMDAAFLRRMNIKVFAGKPDFAGRIKWLDKKLGAATFTDSEKQRIAMMTINFSHDNMNSWLERVKSSGVLQITDTKKRMEAIQKDADQFCISEEIMLGQYRLPEFLSKLPEKNEPKWSTLNTDTSFFDWATPQQGYKCTGRIFIELKAKDEQIQMEQELAYILDEAQVTLLNQVARSCDADNFSTDNEVLESLPKIFERPTWRNLLQMEASLRAPTEYLLLLIDLIKTMHLVRNELLKRNIIYLPSATRDIITLVQQVVPPDTQDYQALLNPDHAVTVSLAHLIVERQLALRNAGASLLRVIRTMLSRQPRCHTYQMPEPNFVEALKILVRFALEAKIHSVQLLDVDFILRNKVHSDEQAIHAMKEVINECKQYSRSMIIFDLDSLVEVNKEFMSMKQGMASAAEVSSDSFNYRISRPLLLSTILRLFKSQATSSGNQTMWMVVISNHHYLSRIFKSKLKWPLLKSEKVAKERQKQLKETKYTCKYCGTVYTELENSPQACGKHPSWARCYLAVKDNNNSTNKSDLKHRSAFKEALESGAVHNVDIHWTCCSAVGYYNRGCIPCRHERYEENEKPLSL